MSQTARRRLAVVPHTHWDREWYDAYQTFRLRLVETVDGLLDLMEADPGYRHFQLDGQLAAVDDYLEARPEHRERLAALCSAGRVSVGPWYALMDEFLVSGETIVRNLQMGIRRAADFGGPMEVGYLPDMFGHTAQMPQILAQAGMAHAVVWRGVPSSIDRTAFWWEAADGSRVRAEYLVAGYGNGAAIPADARTLVDRLRAHVAELAPFLTPDQSILLMNGTDHQAPQPWLSRVVAEANAASDDLELEICSLPDYLADAPVEGLPSWTGELRSGARANVLMGVTSNRVDVKQAAAAAERSLERWAEPLSALFLAPEAYPARLLDLAWREVVVNSAHDSICACSADEVVDAVLHRYREARQIGDGLRERALRALAASMAEPGTVVVNAAPRARSGVVSVVLPAEGPPGPDVQVVAERGGLPGFLTLDAQTVKSVLTMIQGARIDDDLYVTGVALTEDDTGFDLSITVGTDDTGSVPVDEVKRDLYTRLSARPDAIVRVALDQPPIRRVLAVSDEVPGFGWRRFTPRELRHPVRAEAGERPALDNGLVRVEVDPATGTFALDGLAGLGRLVDGGDLGDTYNYSPPTVDRFVDTPEEVRVEVVEEGPVVATLLVTARYTWPTHVDGPTRARVGDVPVEVTTRLTCHAEEAAVRVRTELRNPARDHRLRIHFPLPEPAAVSRAEAAFDVVERGLEVEGRADELGLPTFPALRFVQAGGLTVVHDGVVEYELVDVEGGAAATLAITALRATGMLSRLGMAYRPLPAGPMTPLEGPQMIGDVRCEYALALGDVDPFALADDVLVPLATAAAFGGGPRPAQGSALDVRGAEVTSVRRLGGLLEVRVHNPLGRSVQVEVGERRGWLVDLRGATLAPVDRTFELRPHGIATVRLMDA